MLKKLTTVQNAFIIITNWTLKQSKICAPLKSIRYDYNTIVVQNTLNHVIRQYAAKYSFSMFSL